MYVKMHLSRKHVECFVLCIARSIFVSKNLYRNCSNITGLEGRLQDDRTPVPRQQVEARRNNDWLSHL